MKFSLSSAVTALAAGLIATASAFAQDSVVREETQFEDWTVQCVTQGENPKQCAAITRARNAAGDRDMAIISVQLVPTSNTFTAFLTVPTNVLIGPGIGIEVDLSQVTTAQYEACTQQNCRAALEMSGGIVSSLSSGFGAALVLTDIQGTQQRANFSLAGLSAALDKLRAE